MIAQIGSNGNVPNHDLFLVFQKSSWHKRWHTFVSIGSLYDLSAFLAHKQRNILVDLIGEAQIIPMIMGHEYCIISGFIEQSLYIWKFLILLFIQVKTYIK